MAGYTLEGQRWVGIGGSVPVVTWSADATVNAAMEAELLQAFATWTSVANITFMHVASGSNITISLGSVDGPNHTLGIASYSYTGSTLTSAHITFDSGEGWHSSATGIVSAWNSDFSVVALHEIGHAIGLDHYDAEPAVMNAFLDPRVSNLTSSDIAGIQALYGAPAGMMLAGTAANDVLLGGAGDDHLWGGTGTDYIDGGAGYDYARFDYAAAGVTARLDNLPGSGEAAGDYYLNVEGLVGSSYGDVLVGDGGANTLIGLAGDDVLHGQDGNDGLVGGEGNDQFYGGEGTDFLDGGAGFDFARYDYAGSGVAVDLSTGVGSAGQAAGDFLVDIEGLVGSYFGDNLAGSAAANTIFGLGGDDVITGRGGADHLYGGAGNDTFVFSAADFQAGTYTWVEDFGEAAGDFDVLAVLGVSAADIRYFDTPNGALITTAALNGSGGIIISHTLLAQLPDQFYIA